MKKLTLMTALMMVLATPAFAETAKVSVNGLVCDFCARALEKVFGKQEGVKFSVIFDNKTDFYCRAGKILQIFKKESKLKCIALS